VIGFGLSGRVFHARFLSASSNYELSAIVERHTDAAQKIYPTVKIYRSTSELMNDPEIDLIIITTPNNSHFPLAKEALEKGKHVVMEKPFTVSTDEALELIQLVQKQQGKYVLYPYQNRRYDSGFRTIRQIIDQKLLGEEIVEMEIHFDRYRPQLKTSGSIWREQSGPGSGILYDLGSHLVDQALCLFGHPKTITANVRKQRLNAQSDDYFDIRLEYGKQRRLRVILKASMFVREMGPRYQIHGTKGSFLKYGDDVQESELKSGRIPDINGRDWGKEPEHDWGLLHTEISDGQIIKEKYPTLNGDYGSFYEDLYQTIVHSQPLKIRAEDGYNTIRLIELAQQSSQEKRTIICDKLL